MYCGNRSLPFKDFVNMLAWCGTVGKRFVRSMYRDIEQQKTPLTLLQALIWTANANATDPRDKIYSVLGLCIDGFEIMPLPSYEKPVEQVFRETTRAIIVRAPQLNFLGWRSKTLLPEHNLPSWIPDWVNLRQHLNFHELQLVDAGYFTEQLELYRRFSKRYELNWHSSVEFRGDILKVRGVISDTVDGLASCFFTADQLREQQFDGDFAQYEMQQS